MTRPQWLLVALIGAVAALAYVKADTLARQFGADTYQPPDEFTA